MCVLLALVAMHGVASAQGSASACTGEERAFVVAGTSVEVRNLLNRGVLSLVDGQTWRSAEFQPVSVGRFNTLQSLAFPTDGTDGAYFFGVAVESQGGFTGAQGESAVVVRTCAEALGGTSSHAATSFGDAVTSLLAVGGLSLLGVDDFSARFPDAVGAYPTGACTTWRCSSTAAGQGSVGGSPPSSGVGTEAPTVPEGESEPESATNGEAVLWTRSSGEQFANESLSLLLSSGVEIGVIEIAGARRTAGGGEFMEFALDITNLTDCPLEVDWRFTPVGGGNLWGATTVPISVAPRSQASHTALVDVVDLSSGTLGAEWDGVLLGCDEDEVELAVVREVGFELQGMNTSDCGLFLEWTFLVEDRGTATRAALVDMRMPDRRVQFYQTSVELGGGRLSAEWSGTTRGCPDDLDQSYFGTIELWDFETSELVSTRAAITSYTGKALGFVYVIPKIIAESPDAAKGMESEGAASSSTSADGQPDEFDPRQLRSRWARRAPYVPGS